MDACARLNQWVKESSRIVFFGGAGVSTESGIPDFRSVDGLYNQHYRYPPEVILSRSFFDRNPEEFFRFYREKMLFPDAKPNDAHKKLAELEKAGKLSAVITQNIDGLHFAAGSRKVFELHGSVYRNTCESCGRSFPGIDFLLTGTGIPRCSCGGIIKPDVVLYEEPLDEAVFSGAIAALRQADLLIVGGTSLAVYPAAGLIRYFKGGPIAVINASETPLDDEADLIIHEKIGKVFQQISIGEECGHEI